MNPSPARTVLDEVITWAGITTQPTARGATAILFDGHLRWITRRCRGRRYSRPRTPPRTSRQSTERQHTRVKAVDSRACRVEPHIA